jgi:type IV pilus assembly protein PilY1
LTKCYSKNEGVISTPIIRHGNIVFSTFVTPASTNLCQDPTGWLMELNGLTGGAPIVTPFDTNNDGLFSSADNLSLTFSSGTVTAAAAGLQSPVGAFGTTTVFMPTKNTEFKVLNGSNGRTLPSKKPC